MITRMNADGSGQEVFARGIRNTVGFTWHPITKQLWFTDNGRDWLGDDAPPCELNVATRAGLDFGFPYCHGKDIKDPEFGQLGECSKITPPVQLLGAHVAPLGVKFYTGNRFPEEYRSEVFIAEHGSWNRKEKNGYRITRVKLDGTRGVKYEPFATGFNRGDDVFGRPVDLLVLEDGSMLVSDDTSDAIYRISVRDAMKAIAAFFGFVWRALDALRKVLHLIVLLVLFLGLAAALSPSIPIVPHKTALVIAPQGTLVEQLAGDPFDRAVAELYGQQRAETLVRDLVDAIEAAKTTSASKRWCSISATWPAAASPSWKRWPRRFATSAPAARRCSRTAKASTRRSTTSPRRPTRSISIRRGWCSSTASATTARSSRA